MQKVQIEMTLSEEDCTILRLITKQGDTYSGGQGISAYNLARLTRFGLIYKDELLAYILTDLGWTLMYNYRRDDDTSRYRIVPAYRWHTIKVDGLPEDETNVLIGLKSSGRTISVSYSEGAKQFCDGEYTYQIDEVAGWHPFPADFGSLVHPVDKVYLVRGFYDYTGSTVVKAFLDKVEAEKLKDSILAHLAVRPEFDAMCTNEEYEIWKTANDKWIEDGPLQGMDCDHYDVYEMELT